MEFRLNENSEEKAEAVTDSVADADGYYHQPGRVSPTAAGRAGADAWSDADGEPGGTFLFKYSEPGLYRLSGEFQSEEGYRRYLL